MKLPNIKMSSMGLNLWFEAAIFMAPFISHHLGQGHHNFIYNHLYGEE